MKENIILTKSTRMADLVFKINEQLIQDKRWDLSRQVFRSGTSISANIHEAQHAESNADFLHKMSIALKESREFSFWIMLVNRNVDTSNWKYWSELVRLQEEVLKILISIVKKLKLK